jgi:hypothetical protein
VHSSLRESAVWQTCPISNPTAFQVREETHPGNSDEKLRCEVAIYIWIRENCPISRYFSFIGSRSSMGKLCVNVLSPFIGLDVLNEQ